MREREREGPYIHSGNIVINTEKPDLIADVDHPKRKTPFYYHLLPLSTCKCNTHSLSLSLCNFIFYIEVSPLLLESRFGTGRLLLRFAVVKTILFFTLIIHFKMHWQLPLLTFQLTCFPINLPRDRETNGRKLSVEAWAAFSVRAPPEKATARDPTGLRILDGLSNRYRRTPLLTELGLVRMEMEREIRSGKPVTSRPPTAVSRCRSIAWRRHKDGPRGCAMLPEMPSRIGPLAVLIPLKNSIRFSHYPRTYLYSYIK